MPLTEQEEFELLSLEREKSRFGSTDGGAAVGNPNIKAQGETAYKGDVKSPQEQLAAIGSSGAIGATLGALGAEIAKYGGRAVSAIPHPAAKYVGAAIEATEPALRAAGRVKGAIGGGMSGLASETLGQGAEALDTGPVVAEVARVAGGVFGVEPVRLTIEGLKKYVITPSFTVFSKIKKEALKGLLGKIESAPDSMSVQEREYVDKLISEIRGGSPSIEPLQRTGSLMGAEGKRLLSQSELQMAQALRKQGTIGTPGGSQPTGTELSDIGESIRAVAIPRYEALDAAQKSAYQNTAQLRDKIVRSKEGAGQFVSDMPQYSAVVGELQSQLDNTNVMRRSPSVQATYSRILNDLTNHEQFPGKQKLVHDGFNLNLVTQDGKNKPISFQSLDDVRRKLGEAFKGKPPEGYEGIEKNAAKELYGKIRDIQVEYAGGKRGPQDQLLADYAADIPGLQTYTSKLGKRITGLDQYREGVYATDPADIPKTFFRTRESVKTLKELMGNPAKVNAAALEYADKSLAGLNAEQARKWYGKNSEWLAETGTVRNLVGKYVDRLDDAERSLNNAERFMQQARVNNNMLVGKGVPPQRAIDLIKSGDAEFWGLVTPVIVKSPQAKKDMVAAVRQVVADMPNTEATTQFFNINVRPFLEQSKIASQAEMDFISKRLKDINDLKIPEPEKLKTMQRIMLNSAAGWASSAAGRGTSMLWAVPE